VLLRLYHFGGFVNSNIHTANRMAPKLQNGIRGVGDLRKTSVPVAVLPVAADDA
jgi:hypothetical protein